MGGRRCTTWIPKSCNTGRAVRHHVKNHVKVPASNYQSRETEVNLTYEESVAHNVRCGVRRGPENVVPRIFACLEESKRAAWIVAPVNPHVLSPERVGDDSDGDEHNEHASKGDVDDTALAVARGATPDAVDRCEERAELYAYSQV